MELPSHIDPAYITRVVRALCVEGDVVEVRILGVSRAGHVSGYFDDYDRLASAVARYDGRAEATYMTINPVQPALLARGNNRLVEWVKYTTSDADVVCRRWMLIDFDPVRPSGISSSDIELQAAFSRRGEVVEWLDLAGFPAGLSGMSGNGAHLLYRLDSLPNDEEHTTLIQACIAVIAARFGDKLVDVDRKVFNPARLCKLYGTLVRKGENMPDRPHRRSCLDMPDTLPERVSVEQLRWLADQGAETARVNVPRTATQVTVGRRLDVPAYLGAYGLTEGRDYRVKQKRGMTWYNLRVCPVHASPSPNFECGICQSDDGALGAKCQHDSSKTWRDFKAVLGDPLQFYIGSDIDQTRPSVSAAIVEDRGTTVTHISTSAPDRKTSREIDLSEVLAFARCPTEHLWRYEAGMVSPLTGNQLVQDVVRDGLLCFYTGDATTPLQGVQDRWRERLEAWDIAKAYETLDLYARTRLEIMIVFLTGQIRKPDGELYRAPRMTEAYRQLSEKKGLLALRAELDRVTGGVPVVLADDEALADLFADTVEIALRFQKPLPAEIIGVQEPFSVILPGEWVLAGCADLAAWGDDDGKASLEVWDFAAASSSWPILRRDLRVAAALHARSGKWPAGVDRVRVRYLRTGEIVDVFGRNVLPWTQTLLVAACQATQRKTGVPRLAVSALQCRGCPYWTECTSDGGWNVLGKNHEE